MYKCPCTKLYYEIIFHTLQSTCLIKKFRSFWGFRFALSQLKGVLRHFQEIFFEIFSAPKTRLEDYRKVEMKTLVHCVWVDNLVVIGLTLKNSRFWWFLAGLTTLIVYFISWTISQRSHAIQQLFCIPVYRHMMQKTHPYFLNLPTREIISPASRQNTQAMIFVCHTFFELISGCAKSELQFRTFQKTFLTNSYRTYNFGYFIRSLSLNSTLTFYAYFKSYLERVIKSSHKKI